MKGKISAMIGVTLAIALLLGCGGVPKVKAPKVVPEKPGKLAHLYLTTDIKQMTGVAKTYAKMTVGQSMIVYVRGGDETGKWFELPADVVVNWKPDMEIEVTPTTGHIVTVKAFRPADVASYLEATAMTKDGNKIEAMMQIEIK